MNLPSTKNQILIIFTRYPEPGKSKTRLIAALGEEGAAAIHREMAEFTLSVARYFARSYGASLEIRYEGANRELMKKWLGAHERMLVQGEGELGARLAYAFAEAFQLKMRHAVIIGTDCPGITADILQSAFDGLRQYTLVLGPAKDGGYYLIGLNRFIPQLFDEIDWGTSKVLQQTMAIAKKLNLSTMLLETLRDVDRPEDIIVWKNARQALSYKQTKPCISIIIPTLNEQAYISDTIGSTRQASNIEVIVVDGGSSDGTAAIARSCGAMVIVSEPGRARQMNRGASLARGELLLFLHGDTILPAGFDKDIRRTLDNEGNIAGAFRLAVKGKLRGINIIEKAANLRAERLQMPYGDQAIFLRRATFHELGGFPDVPIMEDYMLIRRLRRFGRINICKASVTTSPRRWQNFGIWKTTFINWFAILAYRFGVPLSSIAKMYYPKDNVYKPRG